MHPLKMIMALAATVSASGLPARALSSTTLNVTQFTMHAGSAQEGAVYNAELEIPNTVTSCHYAPRVSQNNTWCPETPALDGFDFLDCDNHHFSWSIKPAALEEGQNVPRYFLYMDLAQDDGPTLKGCFELGNSFYCAPTDVENPGQVEAYNNDYYGTTPPIVFTLDDVETPTCANTGS